MISHIVERSIENDRNIKKYAVKPRSEGPQLEEELVRLNQEEQREPGESISGWTKIGAMEL